MSAMTVSMIHHMAKVYTRRTLNFHMQFSRANQAAAGKSLQGVVISTSRDSSRHSRRANRTA
jgi:hypothetical protein